VWWLAGAALALGLAGHELVGGEQLGGFCITYFSWVFWVGFFSSFFFPFSLYFFLFCVF